MGWAKMIRTVKKKIYTSMGRKLAKRYGEMLPDSPSPLEVPQRWVEPHKIARIHRGQYEKDEAALVREHLDPTIDTVELGTGIGVISSRICGKLNPSARYVGLEGNPELVEVATRNMQRFDASVDRTIEHAMVVGTYHEGSTRKFFITPGNFHASSLEGGKGGEIEVDVPELSVSEVLRRYKFGEFQLVADVEGAEYEILTEDSVALENCRRVIIELHDCKPNGTLVSIQDLANKFEQIGFHQIANRGDVFAFERK